MSESGEYNLLDQLAEEFAERFRRGERPALKEYTDRYPELADDIRELFPALVKVEQVEGARDDGTAHSTSGCLPPLARLGDYRIIREVGRGGMGVVYEAEQVSLGRHVALKVLPKQLLMHARTRQRFEREAKAAARLHHTNIVPVFGIGEHEGLPYYVMQFIQGLGLDEVLEELKRPQSAAKAGGESAVAHRDGSAAGMARSLLTGQFLPAADDEATLPDLAMNAATEAAPSTAAGTVPPAPASASAPVVERLSGAFSSSSSSVVLPGSGTGGPAGKDRPSYWHSVARIGLQVADALHHAHAQGVLHRDIKPSNLLLDTAGVVWVTDFGLAKAADQKDLTDTGDILGTLRYMAPEAFDGRSDARADVYSLGLTLYELLARRPAYDEKERDSTDQAGDHERTDAPGSAESGHPARPGDHRPEGDRARAGPSVSDRERADGRPATLPRRRADPGPSADGVGAMPTLVQAKPGPRRDGRGADGGVAGGHRHLADRRRPDEPAGPGERPGGPRRPGCVS